MEFVHEWKLVSSGARDNRSSKRSYQSIRLSHRYVGRLARTPGSECNKESVSSASGTTAGVRIHCEL